ncbi:NAD(P)-dependent alcohol dehydrogenase [Agromyces sp. NPDC057865]|uniref:NAD(P)-dependent alcohol dehydrogenase n=1 Tax=Agromyces sp. NPDC057865 TaxID=3346267 RepID=UPI00366FC310
MKAAVHRRLGGREVLQIGESARPGLKTDEILIAVHATTLRTADHRSGRRSVLGMDVAGVVEAIGHDVDGFEPGNEVVAMSGSRPGRHADYVIVKATEAVARMPRNLGFDEAASIVFGGITAQAYLNQVTVQRGTTVLVNGASGAVGSALVQMARAVGARVTGVCSAANEQMVTGLRTKRTIDYAIHDFIADGFTYDVIIDCVGNAPVDRVHASVNAGGAVLLVAVGLRSLLSAKRDARRYGITVVTGPGPYRAEDLKYVMFLAEEGDLRPVVDRTFPVEDTPAAHRYVDLGRERGSVVIHVAESAHPVTQHHASWT